MGLLRLKSESSLEGENRVASQGEGERRRNLELILAQEHVGDAVLDGEDAAGLAADELTLDDVDLEGVSKERRGGKSMQGKKELSFRGDSADREEQRGIGGVRSKGEQ